MRRNVAVLTTNKYIFSCLLYWIVVIFLLHFFWFFTFIHSFIYLLNRIKIDWDMLLLPPLVCRRGEMGEARNCCYIRRESPYRLSLRLLCFHQNFLIPLSLELSWSTPNIQNHWCLETSKEHFVRVCVYVCLRKTCSRETDISTLLVVGNIFQCCNIVKETQRQLPLRTKTRI